MATTPFPLTVRPAQPSDVSDLVALGIASNATSIGKTREFAGREDDIARSYVDFVPKALGHTLVAESDGVLLGFVATNGATDQIGDLWIDPKHQNKGVGSVLLASGEAAIRARGFSCSWLTAHSDNKGAINFYRTHGYALLAKQETTSTDMPDINYTRVVLGKQLSRPDAAKATTMLEVRAGIDMLDPMLVSLLAERFAFIDRAADLKPALNMPARVPDRVEEVVNNARQQALGMGFDPELTEALWRTMVDLAIAREERTLGPDAHEPDTDPHKDAAE